MRKLLSAILIICLLTPIAMAEEPDVDFGETEGALTEFVDEQVDEVCFDFGDDGVEPEPEELILFEDFSEPLDDADCYLDCPDVRDVKYMVSASDRVYPGALLWPLPGKAPLRHLSSHVGWRDAARIHRGQGGDWASWLHHGIDVANVTTKQLVVAAASGVAYAGEQRGNGKYVVIDHGNGFYTKYQHLSRYAGEMFDGCRAVPVAAGDPIGYVGNSGGNYPVHFHFEIAFSPDGAGADDAEYHYQTHNREIIAYSFEKQDFVEMHWPERWELCSAEYQTFVSEVDALDPNESEAPGPMGEAVTLR